MGLLVSKIQTMIQTASSYLLEMFFDRDLFHRFNYVQNNNTTTTKPLIPNKLGNYVQKPLKIKYIKL
jgi:hypothetical protein